MSVNLIKIANLLITRKCNLNCSYCRISADINYKNKPKEYPSKDFYFKNEATTEEWINCIDLLKKHNPDIFLIIYGGEPFLRKDLVDIVKHCNKQDVNYTIISSCNRGITKLIDDFFVKMYPDKVKGFTASVDPEFHNDWLYNDISDDRLHKSNDGFKTLIKLAERGSVKDLVAEITVSASNIDWLESTVSILSSYNITSDITMVDIAKNNYYDFSSVTDDKELVPKNEYVKKIIDSLINSDLEIHMKKTLLPKIYEILPANLDCNIEKNLHNITLEPNLELRTCLRIRGIHSPKYKITDLFDENGKVQEHVHNAIKKDKKELCKGCFWSCMLMSQMDSHEIINH